ncbi:hypothetical protein FIBSPDRAFT_72268 [Athelia psychrophila]|uniref:Uncharacterized protein n=1 Tax=Athelia psychrophila TaxID=1759441 RepID=A0A166ELX3_9AGAM|nr:hypothetical protein FIBSPDRAFT_72268 [Fibularhizoctonia sp. CBS 109695]
MVLLDFGPMPANYTVLRGKVLQVALKPVEAYTSRCKIDDHVPRCLFLTYERLGEDEIQVKSSRRGFTTSDGMDTVIILGDVLVRDVSSPSTRPTDLPSSPAIPTNSPRIRGRSKRFTNSSWPTTRVSLHAWSRATQARGLVRRREYDARLLFYDTTLVEPFTNADERFSHEPADATNVANTNRSSCHWNLLKVNTLLRRRTSTKNTCLEQFRTRRSWGYSAFHDYAIYAVGYTHPEKIRLIYMFCTLLDQFNNSRVLINDVMSGDFAKYGKRLPAWKESKEDDDLHVNSTSNTLNPKRVHKLGQIIIDEFCQQAKDEGNVQKDVIRDSFQHRGRTVVDPHLTQSWHIEEDWIAIIGTAQMEVELLATKIHVQAFQANTKRRKIELPENMLRNHALEPGSRGPRRNTRFTDLSIEVRQDILRAAAMDFAAEPSPDEIFIQSQEGIARLCTSYSYLYDSEQQSQKWSRFSWDVCTRDLRDIKAHALGMTKTSTQDLYTRSAMEQSSFRRR